MIRTESSGGWQNRDCGIALPYVCKKKPNATADPFLAGEQGMTSIGNGQLYNPSGAPTRAWSGDAAHIGAPCILSLLAS